MQRNLVEVVMGAVVLVVAGVVMTTALKGAETQDAGGYDVRAKFDNISGIAVGSDVRIGGIKVGVVSNMELDEATYQAIATLNIREATKIPNDSTASVASSGLLGEKFIQLVPGGEDRMLGAGGEIAFTQSSVSLEEMIGKFMFSSSGGDKKEEATPAAPSPAEPIE